MKGGVTKIGARMHKAGEKIKDDCSRVLIHSRWTECRILVGFLGFFFSPADVAGVC